MNAIMDILGQADLSIVAWALLLLIVVGFPIEAEMGLRFTKPRILAGRPRARLNAYIYAIISLWVFALAILALGIFGEFAWAELGFQFTFDLPTLMSCAVCATIIGFFVLQLYQAHRSEKMREKYREEFASAGDVVYFLPHTLTEYRTFAVLGVTAGITEEIIFRGFLIWAFAMFMPEWVAAALSLLLFIFMHRYQGVQGLIQVSVMGLIVTALYMLSGSLYPVIILHIAVDVLVNALNWKVRLPEPQDREAQETPQMP